MDAWTLLTETVAKRTRRTSFRETVAVLDCKGKVQEVILDGLVWHCTWHAVQRLIKASYSW